MWLPARLRRAARLAGAMEERTGKPGLQARAAREGESPEIKMSPFLSPFLLFCC